MLASGAKGGEPKLKPMAPEVRVDGSKITMTVPACRLDQLLPLVGGELGLDLKSAPELGHAILLTRVEDEKSESVLNRIADAVDGRWEGNGKSRVLVPDPKKEAANSEKLVQALMAKQENLARLGRGGSLRSSTYQDYVSPEDSSVHFLSKVVPHLDMRKLVELPDFGTYVLTTSKDTLGDPMPPGLVKTLVRMAKTESDWPSDESYRSLPVDQILKTQELRLTVTRRNTVSNMEYDIGWGLVGSSPPSSFSPTGTLFVSFSDIAGSANARNKNAASMSSSMVYDRPDSELNSLWNEFKIYSDLWVQGAANEQFKEAIDLIGHPAHHEPMAGTISKALLFALKNHNLETVAVLPDSLMFLPVAAKDLPPKTSQIVMALDEALEKGFSSTSVKDGWWSVEFPGGASWRSMVSDRKKIASAAQLAKNLGAEDLRVRVAAFAATKNTEENPAGLAWQVYGPPFGVKGLQAKFSPVPMIRQLMPAEVDLLAQGKEVRLNPSDDRARQILRYLIYPGSRQLKRAPEVRPEIISSVIPYEVGRMGTTLEETQADLLQQGQFPTEIKINRTTHRFLLGRAGSHSAYADQLGAMAAMSAGRFRLWSDDLEVFSQVIPFERVMERITLDIGKNRVVSIWTILSEKDMSEELFPPEEIGGEWAKLYQKGKKEWPERRVEKELLGTKSPGEIMDDLLRKQSQEK